MAANDNNKTEKRLRQDLSSIGLATHFPKTFGHAGSSPAKGFQTGYATISINARQYYANIKLLFYPGHSNFFDGKTNHRDSIQHNTFVVLLFRSYSYQRLTQSKVVSAKSPTNSARIIRIKSLGSENRLPHQSTLNTLLLSYLSSCNVGLMHPKMRNSAACYHSSHMSQKPKEQKLLARLMVRSEKACCSLRTTTELAA